MPSGVVAREVAGDGDELVEVLDACLVLRIAARTQCVEISALAQQQTQAVGYRGGWRQLAAGGCQDGGGFGEHRVELTDRRLDLRPDAELARHRQCIAEADAVLLGELGDGRLGHVSDAAPWLVQDAPHRHLVGRVRDATRYASASLISARS